ncbi:LytR family transcriptional regulator, partial [Enterococcus faecalis]|nr:LytR family transcriptional regulator [Enterococcus faecalis]
LPAFTTIHQEQLQGEGQMLNDVYYQLLGVNQLLHMQNTLREQLALPPNNQLSQGDEHTQGYVNYQFYDDSAVFSDGEDASE